MISNSKTPSQPSKLCFLTTGATAPFPALLHSALSAPFLRALAASNYSDLLLQLGQGGLQILESLIPAEPDGRRNAHGVRIAGFEYQVEGLTEEMKATKGGGVRGFWGEGCVVCHAGRLEHFGTKVAAFGEWMKLRC